MSELSRVSRFKLRALLGADELRRRAEIRHAKASAPEGPPKCYGDVYRAGLQVGFERTPGLDYDALKTARIAEADKVRAWLDTVRLPDLISPTDFCEAIPEHVAAGMSLDRLFLVVGRYLTAKGATTVQIQTPNRTIRICRHRARYGRMTGRELWAEYQRQQEANGGARSVAERPCRRSGVRDRPAPAVESAARPSASAA